MSNLNEIMEKYKAGEITLEEANEQLRQQGANFHLEPMTDEERGSSGRTRKAPSTSAVAMSRFFSRRLTCVAGRTWRARWSGR